jgi:RHS repeat-associated protein
VYSYDVFGATRNHSGASAQPFTFTGEQGDGELGLVFLRARYYDPAVGRFTTQDKWPRPIGDIQEQNRYIYARNSPINLLDPSGFASTYWKARVGAFLGLGASLEYARYTDVETGKSEGLWSLGAGGGLGLKGTVESGISTSRSLPSTGVDIRARANILGLGVSSKADLGSGKATVGGSVPSVIPFLGLKSEISDDLGASSSAVASFGPEASGTLNIRYRTGQLGDWLFDTFWQPRYDTERQRIMADHERRMTEIQLMKSTSGGVGGSWGGPPSQGK